MVHKIEVLFWSIIKSFQIHNLGNGNLEKDQGIACNEFIWQEFPLLVDCDEIPHEPTIVPEAYLYQGMTEKVNF